MAAFRHSLAAYMPAPDPIPASNPAARAAIETALRLGIAADRCEVLQDGHTLVVRLTESLVARVVQGEDGPRQGMEWFARETAIAQHLTENGAPVIPLHPDIPPGPHEHLGFPLNFWELVTATGEAPCPAEAARRLGRCHRILHDFPQPLPRLAILTEALALLKNRALFPDKTLALLHRHLMQSLEALQDCPLQPLHGDAHMGNVLATTRGLLWTDWEDAFAGPVEWDVASLLWNARFLDGDAAAADQIVAGYEETGAPLDHRILEHCCTARAAVMSAWYPILYPNPSPERQAKLQHRLAWLEERA